MVFLNLNQKISPLSVQKNISDGVGSRNDWNGTSLNPPLFWLDNIFKQVQNSIALTALVYLITNALGGCGVYLVSEL